VFKKADFVCESGFLVRESDRIFSDIGFCVSERGRCVRAVFV
jgi:hypothetical protein